MSVYGEGDKGSLRIAGGGGGGGGGSLFMVLFHLVFSARYQLGHCPVSCSGCNIYLFIFLSNVFLFFLMYILIDSMQRIQ